MTPRFACAADVRIRRRYPVCVVLGLRGPLDEARADFAEQLATVGQMPAYRASLNRAGLPNPADTLVIGDDTTVTDAVKRYQDAGVTDLIVVPLNDRSRTLELLLT
jgi:5,10-methylenetetrahydromethanopterin reductase